MRESATLIEQDLSVASRCYFFGTTTLGGTDACRPEMQADGSIILRSLNLSHVAYRVTEEKYRELRQHPQRKVGMWEFIREDDQDADHIASATRYPQSAGRRIGDLERALAAKDAEIARLREALVAAESVMAKNIYPKPDVGPEHPWSVLQNVRAALKEKADV